MTAKPSPRAVLTRCLLVLSVLLPCGLSTRKNDVEQLLLPVWVPFTANLLARLLLQFRLDGLRRRYWFEAAAILSPEGVSFSREGRVWERSLLTCGSVSSQGQKL